MLKRLALCAAMSLAPVALGGVNTWTSVGPDGGSIYGGAKYVAPNIAVAVTTGGIYRTVDAGATWTRSFDFGPSSVYVGLATNPVSGTQVLAHGDGSSSILRSVDGGATFTRTEVTTGALHVSAAAFTRDGASAWVGLADGRVFRSGDGGATWVERSTGLPPNFPISRIDVDATDPQRLWLLTGLDIYRTSNDGATWARINGAGSYWGFFAARDTHDLLFAVLSGSQNELLRSTDGGVTFAPTGQVGMSSYAFATAGNTVFAMDSDARVVVSTDNGVTWAPRAKPPLTTALTMALDPANANNVLVATNAGMAFSSDAGQTWSVRHSGIHETTYGRLVARHGTVNTVYALTFDDQVVWRRDFDGTWSGIGSEAGRILTPAAPNSGGFGFDWARSAPGTLYVIKDGVAGRSSDEGATWEARGDVSGARAIAVDPQDAQVAYIGNGQPGFARKTIDGGATWAPIAGGLPSGIEEILVDPSDSQTLYAVRNPFGGTQPAIYKSTNGSTTWAPAASGIGDTFVSNVVLHPARPQTLYACGFGGVWRTTNGGTSWTRIFNLAAYDIAVDPAPPHALYVSANESSARSVDDGATWETLGISAIGGGNTSHVELVPGRAATALLSKGHRGLNEITIAPDVRLSANMTAYTVGVTQTARVTIANAGTFSATDVRLTGVVPASAPPATVQASGANCGIAGTALTCTVPILRAAQSATFDLTLNATTHAQTLGATVTAFESDSAADNNAVSIVAERRADLRPSLTSSASSVQTGATFTYTLTLANDGPSPAANVMGILILPPGVNFASLVANGLTCTNTGAVTTCTAATMAPGASGSAVVTVNANAGGPGTATVNVTGEGPDPLVSNNGASLAVTVTEPPPAGSSSGGSSSSSSSSGGGKKGGGSLDYLLLAALTALLAGGAARRLRYR